MLQAALVVKVPSRFTPDCASRFSRRGFGFLSRDASQSLRHWEITSSRSALLKCVQTKSQLWPGLQSLEDAKAPCLPRISELRLKARAATGQPTSSESTGGARMSHARSRTT